MRISTLPQILRRYGTSLPRRILQAWSEGGWSGLRAKARDALGHHRPISEFYGEWIRLYDTLSDESRRQMRADVAKWARMPTITVLMPVAADDLARTRAAIASCQAQLYPKWELCISLGASASPDFRETIEALANADNTSRIAVLQTTSSDDICAGLNNALATSSGDFFALLDSSDLLAEQALYWVAKEIVDHPTVDLIFSDEDRIGPDGRRFEPRFKPDWNPALMLSCNAFGRLGVYRKNLVQDAGGFRPEFASQQEYDLVLRCAALTAPEQIRHIPRILYHRGTANAADAEAANEASTSAASTVDTAAWATGRLAIDQHLQACGVHAAVDRSMARSGLPGRIRPPGATGPRQHPAAVSLRAASDRTVLEFHPDADDL